MQELSEDIVASPFFFAYTAGNDRAYFAAYSDGFGTELWMTDGTPDGTQRVTDINAGADDSLAHSRYVGVFDDQAIFYTDRNGEAGDLWISDGRNTRLLVEREHSSRYGFELLNGQAVNDQFVFSMRDADGSYRLWQTNGTVRGTTPVPGTESLSVDPQLTQLGGFVYFIAHDGERSRLYRTDGTSEPEVIDTPTATDGLGSATVLNGKLFYLRFRFNSEGVYQSTSVKTFDGVRRRLVMTTAGVSSMISLRGRALISVSFGASEDRGLYLSDGTAPGTEKVADQYGTNFGEVGSVNLFMADDPVVGREPHELTLDAGVSFRQTDELSFNELGEISVPVTLLAQPEEDVIVRVTVSDGSEAAVTSQDLVFTSTNWFEDQVATITGVNEERADGDRRINVRADVIDSGDDYSNQRIQTKAVVYDVSNTPTLDDGILTVIGSDGADDIQVHENGNEIEVFSNGARFDFLASNINSVTVETGLGADRIENTTALPTFVESGGGDDTIITGDGKDVIFSGADNDVVRTGKGADTVNAGFGDDDVQTGAGRDRALGGNGADTINGGSGRDTIDGGSSNDVLIGSDGHDQLTGQSGADLILGGRGDDTISGGTGRDLLVGGDNEDSLRAGNDADLVISGTVEHPWMQLQSILSEWRSSRAYDARIANILGQGTEDRENGDVFLRPGTEVNADSASDSLFASGGRDWFFNAIGEDRDRLDFELLSEL